MGGGEGVDGDRRVKKRERERGRGGNRYHIRAHMKFTVAVNSQQGLGIWKAIILHK